MKTTLESGAWVEHRPIQDLKAKDKDAVSLSVKMAIPITEEGEIDRSQGLLMSGAMQLAARNAVIARVITGWSYEVPVPYFEAAEVHDAESIDEIPIDDFNEIEELVAPYLAKLRQRPDPKGVTTSASNGSSRARPHLSPPGLSRESYEDCIRLIRFKLHPGDGGGRMSLPVEVDTWLLPVQQAIDKAREEASKK